MLIFVSVLCLSFLSFSYGQQNQCQQDVLSAHKCTSETEESLLMYVSNQVDVTKLVVDTCFDKYQCPPVNMSESDMNQVLESLIRCGNVYAGKVETAMKACVAKTANVVLPDFPPTPPRTLNNTKLLMFGFISARIKQCQNPTEAQRCIADAFTGRLDEIKSFFDGVCRKYHDCFKHVGKSCQRTVLKVLRSSAICGTSEKHNNWKLYNETSECAEFPTPEPTSISDHNDMGEHVDDTSVGENDDDHNLFAHPCVGGFAKFFRKSFPI